MAITSSGYDGSVDEVQMAGMVPKTGASEYGVAGAGDFAVSAVAGQDRTVSIASGTGWGHFILDVSSANETRALAAPASGSRWDMICLHRDWQPVGGATTVKVIQSGSTSTTLPTRDNDPGVTDDQPLALVRVDAGSTTIGDIIDLRCWGRNGGLTAKDTRALQYLTAIGTSVEINGTTWQRLLDSNDTPVWAKTTRHDDTGWVSGVGAGGFGDGYVECRRIGNTAEIVISIHRNGGTITVPSNGNLGNQHIATVPAGIEPKRWAKSLSSIGAGQMFTGYVDTDGKVYLAATTNNSNINTGDNVSLGGFYFTD